MPIHRNRIKKPQETKKQQKVVRQPAQVVLSEKELRYVYMYHLSGYPDLTQVRDLFCLMAFTCQRYEDVQALNWRDLKRQTNPVTWEFTCLKTGKPVVVPLVGFSALALDILKRYRYRMPQMKRSRFNTLLRKLCQYAKLTKCLTSKTARATGMAILAAQKDESNPDSVRR